jgi:predicted ATPase
MTLARLRIKQQRALEAHELLSSRYSRFAEGFQTRDLQGARQLLSQLA